MGLGIMYISQLKNSYRITHVNFTKKKNLFEIKSFYSLELAELLRLYRVVFHTWIDGDGNMMLKFELEINDGKILTFRDI